MNFSARRIDPLSSVKQRRFSVTATASKLRSGGNRHQNTPTTVPKTPTVTLGYGEFSQMLRRIRLRISFNAHPCIGARTRHAVHHRLVSGGIFSRARAIGSRRGRVAFLFHQLRGYHSTRRASPTTTKSVQFSTFPADYPVNMIFCSCRKTHHLSNMPRHAPASPCSTKQSAAGGRPSAATTPLWRNFNGLLMDRPFSPAAAPAPPDWVNPRFSPTRQTTAPRTFAVPAYGFRRLQ